MTFKERVRRGLRQVMNAARSGPGRSRRVRVAAPANVVVARNVGGDGAVHEVSARQTTVVRNDRVEERTERVEARRG